MAVHSSTPSVSAGCSSPRLLCLALHTVLILLHIVLLVLASDHLEHGFNFPFSNSGEVRFSLAVSVVSQTFGTIYLTCLVVITQRIAWANSFHTRQTLTAIHDKVSAWLGLGSALNALRGQFALSAALSGVLLIASYLGGIMILHITVPASSTVNVYNATNAAMYPTELARSYDLELDPLYYDILSVYGQFSTIGLQDNVIYDILPVVSSAVGTTTVNGTVFSADCGRLPNATEIRFVRNGESDNQWIFDIGSGFNGVTVKTPMWNTFATTSASTAAGAYGAIGAVVVASTVPITDSAGVATPNVQIHPAVQVGEVDTPISSLQMVACNIKANNISITVSSVTRTPIEVFPPPGDVVWHDWTPITIVTDPMLVGLDGLSDKSPPSSHWPGNEAGSLTNGASSNIISAADNLTLTTPSMLDVFLMEDLGIWYEGLNITLMDFQSSLGKAVATVTWFRRNRNYTLQYTDEDVQPNPYVNMTGEASILSYTLRMRLHFNTIPLALGLGVSCLLLVLAGTQMHNREPVQYDIDNAGVLQLTWLVGDESHLNSVVEPTEVELRQAGMFEIHMGELLRRKKYQPIQPEGEVELGSLTNRKVGESMEWNLGLEGIEAY